MYSSPSVVVAVRSLRLTRSISAVTIVSQVGVGVAVDDSVVDDVALGQLVLGDNVDVVGDLVESVAVVQLIIIAGEGDGAVAVDLLERQPRCRWSS